jgi:hypothetical protein
MSDRRLGRLHLDKRIKHIIAAMEADTRARADELLDTESAWLLFGQTAAKPRNVIEAVKGRPPGPGPRDRPVNERFLVDQLVRQYPWYWSAGLLAAIWLLCVGVLSFRVKSLDRLK